MAKKLTEKELADILYPTTTQEELEESILDIPPELRRLHTATLDFSISTLLDNLKKGDLEIPEFQRKYVWNDTQASRLVESLIIQCPIPVIYLNQEKSEKMSVIDGNQRIISLNRYVNNQFALKGLTTYPDLEGLKFFQLDPRFQRHISNRTLRCIVIEKETHPQIKFDVFERLNTGAVKLTSQELRHGLYHGTFMKFIDKVTANETFKKLIGSSSKEKRMRPQELAIRFFAFYYDLENYKKPLVAFLNDFSDKNKNIETDRINELTDLFEKTVSNVNNIYGNLAFKIFNSNLKPMSKFNAALFDAEMLSVSHYENKIKPSAGVKDKFYKSLAELFSDAEFNKTISIATSDVNPVRKRIETISKLVKSNLNGVSEK